MNTIKTILKAIATRLHNNCLSLKGRMPLVSGATDGGSCDPEADKLCYENAARVAGEPASLGECGASAAMVTDIDEPVTEAGRWVCTIGWTDADWIEHGLTPPSQRIVERAFSELS